MMYVAIVVLTFFGCYLVIHIDAQKIENMLVAFVIAIILLEFYLLINMEDELRK